MEIEKDVLNGPLTTTEAIKYSLNMNATLTYKVYSIMHQHGINNMQC